MVTVSGVHYIDSVFLLHAYHGGYWQTLKTRFPGPSFQGLLGRGSVNHVSCVRGKGQGRFDYVLFQTFLVQEERKKSQCPKCWIGPFGTGFKNFGRKEP